MKPTEAGTISTGFDLESIKKRYGKVYEVSMAFTPENDLDTEETKVYFRKPSTGAFDRYIKETSKNPSRAIERLCLDSVIEEQKEELTRTLVDYPAASFGIGQKLLAMLGLSDNVNFKML